MSRQEARRQQAEARRHPQTGQRAPQIQAYPGPASDWTVDDRSAS